MVERVTRTRVSSRVEREIASVASRILTGTTIVLSAMAEPCQEFDAAANAELDARDDCIAVYDANGRIMPKPSWP